MAAYHDDAQETVNRVRQVLETFGRDPKRSTAAREALIGPAEQHAAFSELPEYEIFKLGRAASDITGISNPFHRLHHGRASETTTIDGRTVANFSSYDYLGLNGHPVVSAAAKVAIDRFGTSVSASRLTAGEREIHRELEVSLARLHGSEDALAFVSGHATNVSVIGTLLGSEDLILCDSLIHNSVTEGAKLAGAKRITWPHGDLESLERALRLNRARHRRALVVTEGLYSMDGDMPDLAALIKLKRRYKAWLMVDEAHSLGVLGATGRGIAEEQNVPPTDVDIWMGTLSKSLAATGGYIAGSKALIEILKYTTPGFVYSVGLSPPVAAAAHAAIDVMRAEPERLHRLRDNGQYFLSGAKARDLDTGLSIGAAIVPMIIGNSAQAIILADRLLARGFNIVPAIFPGVAENQARLRVFITSQHSAGQIDSVLDAIAEELKIVRSGPSFVSMVAKG